MSRDPLPPLAPTNITSSTHPGGQRNLGAPNTQPAGRQRNNLSGGTHAQPITQAVPAPNAQQWTPAPYGQRNNFFGGASAQQWHSPWLSPGAQAAPAADSTDSTASLNKHYWSGFGESDNTHKNGLLLWIKSELFLEFPKEDRKHAFPDDLRRALELAMLQLQVYFSDYGASGHRIHYKFALPNCLRLSVPFSIRRAVLAKLNGSYLTPAGLISRPSMDAIQYAASSQLCIKQMASMPEEREPKMRWDERKFSKVHYEEKLCSMYVDGGVSYAVTNNTEYQTGGLELRLSHRKQENGRDDVVLAIGSASLPAGASSGSQPVALSDRHVWLHLVDTSITENNRSESVKVNADWLSLEGRGDGSDLERRGDSSDLEREKSNVWRDVGFVFSDGTVVKATIPYRITLTDPQPRSSAVTTMSLRR